MAQVPHVVTWSLSAASSLVKPETQPSRHLSESSDQISAETKPVFPKGNPTSENNPEEKEEHVEGVERAAVQESNVRNWAGLPEDLLVVILGSIKTLPDFYAFRGVCPNWRSVAILSAENLSSLNPFILVHLQVRRCQSVSHIVSDSNADSDSISDIDESIYLDRPSFEARLFDVVTKSFYERPTFWSSWRSRNYLNFDHGYLATAFGDGRVQLRHFLSNERIWLPKTHNPFSNQKNIVFSGNPSSPGCMFALYEHYSPTMEYFLPDDESWRTYNLTWGYLFMDMIFFNGNLYSLISRQGSCDLKQLVVFEFAANISCRLLGNPVFLDKRTYLTSSGGELVLYCGGFLIWDFENQRWIEKESTEGRSLFVSTWQCHACMAPAPGSMVEPNLLYHFDTDNSMLFKIPVDELGEDESDDVNLRELTDANTWYKGRAVWIFPSMLL